MIPIKIFVFIVQDGSFTIFLVHDIIVPEGNSQMKNRAKEQNANKIQIRKSKSTWKRSCQ